MLFNHSMVSHRQLLLIILTCLFGHLTKVDAWFGTKAPASVAARSPLTEQALEIYNKAFPFDREPPKSNPFNDFGMPYMDLDGTVLKTSSRRRNKDPTKQNRRLTDISRDRAAQSFNALVKLYGEQRAFSMVQAQPICLCFDSSQFQPSLEAWTQVFGLEESQDMVARNPGLLAVRSDEAAKASDSTMVFSYIVGYTRPLGPFLLLTLLLLLLTPVIEGVTGIQYGINH